MSNNGNEIEEFEKAGIGEKARVLINIPMVFFSRVIRISSVFVIIAMLARYLGPEQMGKYLIVTAVVDLWFSIIKFGLNTILTREVSRNRDKASQYFITVLFIQFIMIFFCYIIFWLIPHVIHIDKELFMAVFLASLSQVVIFSIAQICISTFYAFEKMQYETFLVVIYRILDIFFIWVVIHWDLGFVSVFMAMVFSSSVFTGLSLWILFTKILKPRLKIDKATIKLFFFESLPLSITEIARTLFTRTSAFILKYFSGDAAVSFFYAPFQLLQRMGIIPDMLVTSIFPLFSRTAQKKDEEFVSAYCKAIKFMGMVSIFLTLFFVFFPKEVIHLLLGKGYEYAEFPLRLLAWVLIPFYLNRIAVVSLIAMNRQNIVTLCILSAFAVNLILQLILVPSNGYIGSCIAAITYFILVFISLDIFIGFHLPLLRVYKELVKPAICGVVLAIFWFSVRNVPFIFAFPSGLCLFLFMLMATKALSGEDMGLVKGILKGKGRRKAWKREMKTH